MLGSQWMAYFSTGGLLDRDEMRCAYMVWCTVGRMGDGKCTVNQESCLVFI